MNSILGDKPTAGSARTPSRRRRTAVASAALATTSLALCATGGAAFAEDAAHPGNGPQQRSHSSFVAPVRVPGSAVTKLGRWHDGTRHVRLAAGVKAPRSEQTLLVGAGDKTPDGLLAKVVGRKRTSGGATVLTTKRSSLNHALPPGTYAFHERPASGRSSARGGSETKSTPLAFTANCSGHVSNLKVTGDLQVNAQVTGHVTITPFWQGVDASIHVVDDAWLKVVLDAAVDCHASYVVADLRWPLEGLGIPGSLGVQVKIDVAAALQGHLELGGRHHGELEAGLEWHTGDKEVHVYRSSSGGFNFDDPVATGSARLEGGVSLNVGFNLLEVIRPHVDLRAYLGAEVDPAKVPWWTVYDGLQINAGVTLPFVKEIGPFTIYDTGHHVLGQAVGITTSQLPQAVTDRSYSSVVDAIGGHAPYSFSLVSGILPPGLSLSSGGTIAGTPGPVSGSQVFPVTIRATDASGKVADQAVALTVVTHPSPVIDTTNDLSGTPGEPYAVELKAHSGTGELTWSTVGAMPEGWLLTPGGHLGTASLPNVSDITVRVTDAEGMTADRQLVIYGLDDDLGPGPDPCHAKPWLPFC